MTYWLRRCCQAIARFLSEEWHLRIDPDAKCPACGNRHGTLRFNAQTKRVDHHCQCCGADWSVEPITGVEAWKR